ncbi:MAG: hypothetical protein IJX96_02660 [Clostridia bacterium]|nr:hypothetical protein [Clostridia bacterium]
MKEKYKIEASLSFGKIFSDKVNFLLYVFLGISLIVPVITVCIIFTIALGEMQTSPNIISSLIFANIFAFFLFGVVLWRIIYNNKLKKRIRLWLNDAIPIKTSARRLDLTDKKYKPYQIEVKFIFQEKKQKYISRAGSSVTGYFKFFSEPAKELNILYSPKYNEILILKE